VNELKNLVVNIMRGYENLKGENMVETYTIRIYQSKQKEGLEEAYKRSSDYYKSKNDFLSDCLERGRRAIERDLFGVRNVKDLEELYSEIGRTTKTLNQLIKISERNAKENLAHLSVNQKLLSCNYNMILGLGEHNPISRTSVENGGFDELPPRYKIILKSLLEEIKNLP